MGKKAIILAAIVSIAGTLQANAAFVITGRGGVIVVPSGSPSSSSSPRKWGMKCVELDDRGEKYLSCERYYPGKTRIGPKPIYHCSFTMYSNVQRGSCSDGKGAFRSDLRGSGHHPREKAVIK